MSKCEISIPFTETPETVIDKARTAIIKAGGRLEGNTDSGDFELSTPIGSISGTYTVSNSTLLVNVEDKPMFVGCGMIEDQLRKYISK